CLHDRRLGLRWRGGLLLHRSRFRDGQRLRWIPTERQSEILPRQLDARLLSQTVDLVVVAARSGRVDVRLGGSAALEQSLREVRLVAAALRGVAENLELPLLPHELVESLLDGVDGREALLLDVRLARRQREIGRGEIVPPLATVEEQLLRGEPRRI